MKPALLFLPLAALPIAVSLSVPARAADADPSREAIVNSVNKSVALLQKTGPLFWKGSGCIACHHHSLPAMTFSVVREHGFKIDEAGAQANAKLASDYMDQRTDRVLGGLGPPGGLDTMNYILFGLASAGVAPTEALEAGARYLKIRQMDDGSWQVAVHRPPLESSTIAMTALTIRNLQAFAPPAQKEEYARAVARGVEWLSKSTPTTTEDHAYKILGAIWGHAPQSAVAPTAASLVRLQREDGGWGQIPTLETDAYATGQALFALQASGMKTTDPVYRRGVAYLLRTQDAEGAWHVKTRAEIVQVYFESGFPYGKDQFISAAGTSWAAAALALTEPKRTK
jgi:hypothetical protein